MAGEFNPGFHQQYKPGGSMSNSSSGSGGYELIPMANYYNSPRGGSMNLSAAADGGLQIFSPSSLLLDSVPGLKHDTGLAVEWSVDEQYKLEEGLAKYANEPHIMQYIKIAASLQDKTVRDVALRCKWMMRKRRKQEDQSLGKKLKDRKDKLMDTSLKNNMSSASSLNVPAYSLPTNHHNQSNYMPPGALSSSARHLLEENHHAFGQISSNLSSLKVKGKSAEKKTRSKYMELFLDKAHQFWDRDLQENIDLFFRTRNNLTTVLNDMKNTPGIMSQMLPLPVLLNEELASSIIPHSFQPPAFGASSSIPMKQEPGC
ncbi:hypothetical protein ACS0TY_010652 [Phlomoides rotata]